MSWLGDRLGIHVNSINDITSGRAIKEAVKNPLVLAAATPFLAPAVGAIASKAGSLIGSLPGVGAVSGAVKGIASHIPASVRGILSGGGSDGKGSFGTLGDLAGSLTNGGAGGSGQVSSLLDKLLLGGTIAAGAADEIQKRNLQNKATDYATSAYDAKAPLRAKALALLQNPSTPDFSAISSDPGNVYDKARRARMLAAEVSKVNPTGGPIQIGGHVFDPSKRGAAA